MHECKCCDVRSRLQRSCPSDQARDNLGHAEIIRNLMSLKLFHDLTNSTTSTEDLMKASFDLCTARVIVIIHVFVNGYKSIDIS